VEEGREKDEVRRRIESLRLSPIPLPSSLRTLSFATYPKNVTFLSISFLLLPPALNDSSLIGQVKGKDRK